METKAFFSSLLVCLMTGWGYGFTISAPAPVKDFDWSTKTGSNRTGQIGWGGGMMTNWIVRFIHFVHEGVCVHMEDDDDD